MKEKVDFVVLDGDPVEVRKDKLNLRPALRFVETHSDIYSEGHTALLQRPLAPSASTKLSEITFPGSTVLAEDATVIRPSEFVRIFTHLPEPVVQLSQLRELSYEWSDLIPVPKFSDDGHLNGAEALVPIEEFPRKGDHPERILIGYTSADAKKICFTAIPPTVSTVQKACWHYQLHVLLHELFHTVEMPFRTDRQLDKSLSFTSQGGLGFSFSSWISEWSELFLSEREPGFVTRYAQSYSRHLNIKTLREDKPVFRSALAEQICETFAAYMLNIAPNKDEWTDFRRESFGNKDARSHFLNSLSPLASKKALLMRQFCESTVIHLREGEH